MNTTSISASELKRNTADVLNRVYYEKIVAVIKRHDEPIVKIVPIEKNKSRKSYFGIMPDFPDVTKLRYFRKRKISL